MLNADTPPVGPAPMTYAADEPAVVELVTLCSEGPCRAVPLGNVELPNCVMPVPLFFTLTV